VRDCRRLAAAVEDKRNTGDRGIAGPAAFDLDADAGCGRFHFELLYHHLGSGDTAVGEADIADLLGQRLHQVDMAGGHEIADLGDDLVVGDNLLEIVIQRRDRPADPQIQVEPHPLRLEPLFRIGADAAIQHQVPHQDAVVMLIGLQDVRDRQGDGNATLTGQGDLASFQRPA
jgi:hypothetical protein